MADSTDILMVLVKDGKPVKGESQVLLSPSDTLLNDTPKFVSGQCFALDSFTLNLESPSKDSEAPPNTPPPALPVNQQGKTGMAPKTGLSKTGVTWQATNLNHVSCSRQLDLSSTVLFNECANAKGSQPTKFDTAAIIRRKVVGGGLQNINQTDQSHLMTYFRIDFKDVQIVQLQWNSAEEGITEEFQFVCSEASVKYSQQLHTGKLSTPLNPGLWKK